MSVPDYQAFMLPLLKLARLMIEHGIGVTEVASNTVRRVDSDYFSEE